MPDSDVTVMTSESSTKEKEEVVTSQEGGGAEEEEMWGRDEDEEEMVDVPDSDDFPQDLCIPAYTAIDIKGDTALLAVSSLTGKSWQSRLEVYNIDPETRTRLIDPLTTGAKIPVVSIAIDCSVSDVCLFPGGDRAIVGLDDGSVCLIRITEEDQHGIKDEWESHDPIPFRSVEHDSRVVRVLISTPSPLPSNSTDIAYWPEVALSMDSLGVVKIWDTSNWMSLITFPAHPPFTAALSCDMALWTGHEGADRGGLATCGAGAVRLWDIKAANKKPILVNKKMKSHDACSLCWLSEDLLAVGSVTGQISIWDRRHMNHSRDRFDLPNKDQIIRMTSSPKEGLLGVLSEDFGVRTLVYSASDETPLSLRSFDVVHHKDHPKSLVFTTSSVSAPQTSLWSCGIDATLYRHDIDIPAQSVTTISVDLPRPHAL